MTIVLGNEYDAALQNRLKEVLRRLGATEVRRPEWVVGGSQEIVKWILQIEGQEVKVESETYIGLSITGPAELITRIQGLLVATAD